MKATLQIPVDKGLKARSEKLAEEYGFSSLQELVRVFLNQLVNKGLKPQFISSDEFLTWEEETVLTKKYLQVKEDIAAGRGYSAGTAEEMIKQLGKA